MTGSMPTIFARLVDFYKDAAQLYNVKKMRILFILITRTHDRISPTHIILYLSPALFWVEG